MNNIKQLDLFNKIDKSNNTVGRPKKINKKIVFKVIEDIKKGLKNDSIIKKYGLKRRTFFRIKSGEYQKDLEEYLNEVSENFTLDSEE